MTTEKTSQERIDQRIKDVGIAVDDYNDTIHAIIGFVNLFLLDDKYQPKPDVKGFQGRHLTPSFATQQPSTSSEEHYVSPDLGIVIQETKGIIGEVKKNFPKSNTDRAEKCFAQLKNYDQDLIGWPVKNENVPSHEIVLLTHYTTSAYAIEFHDQELPKKNIKFKHPFSIVEFTRIPQAQEFFSFKSVLGEPTGGKTQLKYGIQIPMKAFLTDTAKAKLYDAKPPLPYLAELIWVYTVTPLASEDPKFKNLKKRQKIDVYLEIEEIMQQLSEGFSFHFWHSKYPNTRQPHIPYKEWVDDACRFLVEIGDAEWVKDSNETELKFLYQEFTDIKKHFVFSYATSEEKKISNPTLPGFRL
jgi:hypothetical protein